MAQMYCVAVVKSSAGLMGKTKLHSSIDKQYEKQFMTRTHFVSKHIIPSYQFH